MRTAAEGVFFFLLLACAFSQSAPPTAQVYMTRQNTADRLSPKPSFTFGTDNFTSENVIEVFEEVTFQKIMGWGGAFTESAAFVFSQLRPDLQKQVLEAFWGETGIHFNIGRVPMNSCDFSIESYNFANVTEDFELKYFDTNVTHDTVAMIPFIHAAQKTSPIPLYLFASPWSPPGWMKVNGQMGGSSCPCLKNDSKPAWALYYSKYISAYKLMELNLMLLQSRMSLKQLAQGLRLRHVVIVLKINWSL